MNRLQTKGIGSTKRLTVLAGALMAATLAGPAGAQVANGSFEDPALPSGTTFSTVVGSYITGWTIDGSVDLIRTYWAAPDGAQSVDLNGYGSLASLSQSVSLSGAQPYKLSFLLSGNPDGPPDPKTLDVSISGGVLAAQQASVAKPANIPSMTWTPFAYYFTPATTGAYTLTFQSTSDAGGAGNHWGPALDNVMITAIPEPEAYAMMLAGLGLMGWVARRRRQSPDVF